MSYPMILSLLKIKSIIIIIIIKWYDVAKYNLFRIPIRNKAISMINAGTGITPLSGSADQSIMFISRDKPYCDNVKIPGTRITRHVIVLSLTVRPRPSPRSSDIHQRWQDVRMSWCDCHGFMSSDHIEEAGLVKYISYHPPLSLMTPWYLSFCFIISSAPAISPLSKVHLSLIWIRCSPLATPRLLIASPVSQWTSLSTLCPAAAISHPKKPLLLPPPSALACCSIQQSGPLSVV